MDLHRRYLTPEKARALTGLSLKTIYRRLQDGSLRALQPGGRRKRWLIPADALSPAGAAPEGTRSPTAEDRADVVPAPIPAAPPDCIPLPGPRPRWMRRRWPA